MNEYVRNDLEKSNKRFELLIKPKLKELLKGDFLRVENESNDKMREILDQLAGIDSWHIDNLRGLRGIASRIQEIDVIKYPYAKPFNTFTIRNKRQSGKPTEYEKRKYAIEHNYLYPFYTVQAYINNKDNTLMSCAIARTKDIIKFIDIYKPVTNNTGKNQNGHSNFWVISWTEFSKAKYPIRILSKEES